MQPLWPGPFAKGRVGFTFLKPFIYSCYRCLHLAFTEHFPCAVLVANGTQPMSSVSSPDSLLLHLLQWHWIAFGSMPRNCYFSPSSSSTLCPENPWSLFQAQLSIIPFRKSSFTRQLPPVYSLPALCFPHHVTLMYLRLLEIFSSRANLTTHFPPVWLKKNLTMLNVFRNSCSPVSKGQYCPEMFMFL